MLIRNDYFKIIEEIENLEPNTLDEYIWKRLHPLMEANEYFIERLFKDVVC